jgi:hypothetical protein
MNVLAFIRILLLAGASLVAGCNAQTKPGARAPHVTQTITPEMLKAVLGGEGKLSSPADHPQYLNSLDMSTLSSADYTTVAAPLRFLRVRLTHTPQSLTIAKQEFFYQKDEVLAVKTGQPIPDFKQADEGFASQTEGGRNIRMVVRRGTKVVNLHVGGNGGPADQLGELTKVAVAILEQADKIVPESR